MRLIRIACKLVRSREGRRPHTACTVRIVERSMMKMLRSAQCVECPYAPVSLVRLPSIDRQLPNITLQVRLKARLLHLQDQGRWCALIVERPSALESIVATAQRHCLRHRRRARDIPCRAPARPTRAPARGAPTIYEPASTGYYSKERPHRRSLKRCCPLRYSEGKL